MNLTYQKKCQFEGNIKPECFRKTNSDKTPGKNRYLRSNG